MLRIVHSFVWEFPIHRGQIPKYIDLNSSFVLFAIILPSCTPNILSYIELLALLAELCPNSVCLNTCLVIGNAHTNLYARSSCSNLVSSIDYEPGLLT